MRLPLRRAGSPVLLAALVVALAAVPAHAAVKSAADPRTGIVFMLDGPTLTVTPGPATTPAQLAAVQGKPVQVVCMAGVTDLDRMFTVAVTADGEPDLRPQDFDVQLVGRAATWPAGTPSLQVTFARDFSDAAQLCIFGDHDEVVAFLDPAVAALAKADAQREQAQGRLSKASEWMTSRASRTPASRFPRARAVVSQLSAHFPKRQFAYAARVSGIGPQGVVYVVGSGTVPHRLLLATRTAAGEVVTLQVRRTARSESNTFGTVPA